MFYPIVLQLEAYKNGEWIDDVEFESYGPENRMRRLCRRELRKKVGDLDEYQLKEVWL